MKKIILIACCLLTLVAGTTFAGKQQKKHKIKSTTITQTAYENGKPTTYKESYEEFDKNGNTTLFIEYAKDGSVLKKETASYDNNQNVTEQTFFDSKKNKEYKKTYRYSVMKDKTPLVEEAEFDASGKLLKKTSYSYTSSGKKASETVTDATGALIEKTLFIYNSKNLKTFKQSFNKSNMLENVKEWQYDYY